MFSSMVHLSTQSKHTRPLGCAFVSSFTPSVLQASAFSTSPSHVCDTPVNVYSQTKRKTRIKPLIDINDNTYISQPSPWEHSIATTTDRALVRMAINEEADENEKDETSDDTDMNSHKNSSSSNNEEEEMTVYRKHARRKQKMEELLPFSVQVISPPPRFLGTFQLDPLTHCGDVVEYGGQQFEVKVVRLKYKYIQGKYRVIGKTIQVKSLARRAIEIYLENKFQQS